MRKTRNALHETEGILCLYTSLSHYFYYPVKLHRFPRSPGFPETTVTSCFHLLLPGSLAQFLSPEPSSFSLFSPAPLQLFTTQCWQMWSPIVPLLGHHPGSTAPAKVREVGPYSSSHACGAASLPSYCSPVSSGRAPNVCTSSGSARGIPPGARAEC